MRPTSSQTPSLDANTRQDATQKLENASRYNYPEYMVMLSSVLVEEDATLHVRTAAGLALQNAIVGDMARVAECTNRWLNLNTAAKTKIKNETLLTLGSSQQRVGNVASQVVAAIAAVELPVGHWVISSKSSWVSWAPRETSICVLPPYR
ncbi:hypothetical protein B0H17DRAFT_1296525 [Mycena rosella]|uniref:Importin N-terminal domain-containing protein n=1 Tax=Mycena rosella TaxID=1033263 RepID=A0AAD7DDA3_MYCRO|nr:hypothetical protein B0H17DRAFT_1296525 [Mycena rosella]